MFTMIFVCGSGGYRSVGVHGEVSYMIPLGRGILDDYVDLKSSQYLVPVIYMMKIW